VEHSKLQQFYGGPQYDKFQSPEIKEKYDKNAISKNENVLLKKEIERLKKEIKIIMNASKQTIEVSFSKPLLKACLKPKECETERKVVDLQIHQNDF
jgi:hypothetical protein